MARRSLNKNLLIISCSRRKKHLQGKVEAFDLYDGAVFRMIKKLERESRSMGKIEILILSAQYGLIKPHTVIVPYDRVMTAERAVEIRKDVETQLRSTVKRITPEEIFCCLGKNYWKSIEESLQNSRVQILTAEGRIGEKLSCTKRWILRNLA